MRRRKKKGRIDHTRNRTEENKAFLNKLFKDLGEDLKDFDNKGQSVSSCSLVDNKKEESDEDLFQAAMKDVTPLEDNKNKVIKYPVEKESLPDLSLKLNKKVGEDFSSLVKELGAWDVSFSDEYMEGAVSGVGPKIMKRLKRGEFSVQDYIDLHGLTKKEAETVVDKFIIQSYHKGLRCVLIVHGRGLGSIDHKPAIKRELPVWFKRGILKKIVLAFVTAKPCDGGAGALYVLLKKR
jgi:DNA-nicking Smr family endonuclease